SPFCLERNNEAVSNLAPENIERMAPKSIGCSLEEVKQYNTGLINILPKLRINENNEVKKLRLDATEKEHVSTILAQDQPFCIGRMKDMILEDYAVSILQKLRIHEAHRIEQLRLNAREKEHVDGILSQDQPFYVGRMEEMILGSYAVSLLPKLGIHEDNVVEKLSLYASKE
ncbi:MAG: uncharacterized protein A8A55_2898, partial [Amphiamblys sp. WSBS2006]